MIVPRKPPFAGPARLRYGALRATGVVASLVIRLDRIGESVYAITLGLSSHNHEKFVARRIEPNIQSATNTYYRQCLE